MPVAACVGEPFQQQHPGALGPAGAVRARAERLAAAVRGQRPLPAEGDEGVGRGHHRHAAGQGERAVARPQRPDRQVQGDQGGGTGGVHAHRGPFEPQGVGDPPGDHTAGRSGVQQPLYFRELT